MVSFNFLFSVSEIAERQGQSNVNLEMAKDAESDCHDVICTCTQQRWVWGHPAEIRRISVLLKEITKFRLGRWVQNKIYKKKKNDDKKKFMFYSISKQNGANEEKDFNSSSPSSFEVLNSLQNSKFGRKASQLQNSNRSLSCLHPSSGTNMFGQLSLCEKGSCL